MIAACPTVLVVDDDATTRYLVRRCLTNLPLQGQILEAENGQQALALVEAYCQATNAPHSLLVLLDLNMPVMDGLQFLEYHTQLPSIRQQVAAVVVMSTTPSETEQTLQPARQVKSKPVLIEQAAELVRQYLPVALS